MKLFIPDSSERERLFRATETRPTVKEKASWCSKWFNIDVHPFVVRLIAFAIVEGIFGCSSFAAIYWFRGHGVLPGLCFFNELLARDEAMHMWFACLLYSELQLGMASGDILRMVEEAVGLEKAFFAGSHSSLVVVCN